MEGQSKSSPPIYATPPHIQVQPTWASFVGCDGCCPPHIHQGNWCRSPEHKYNKQSNNNQSQPIRSQSIYSPINQATSFSKMGTGSLGGGGEHLLQRKRKVDNIWNNSQTQHLIMTDLPSRLRLIWITCAFSTVLVEFSYCPTNGTIYPQLASEIPF